MMTNAMDTITYPITHRIFFLSKQKIKLILIFYEKGWYMSKEYG
jgi:hypothetical protein